MRTLVDIVWLLGQAACVAALGAGALLVLFETELFAKKNAQSGRESIEIEREVDSMRRAA